MSLKTLKSELDRIAQKLGAADESILMIVLAVIRATKDEMATEADFPSTAGHQIDYRIQGRSQTFFFPFAQMDSDQAEELAKALIAHTRKAERLGRFPQVGVFDLRCYPSEGAHICTWPAEGCSVEDHAAELYRLTIESRNEHA
jgi:hypothetical protein